MIVVEGFGLSAEAMAGSMRLDLAGRGLRHDRARLDAGAVIRDPVDEAVAGLAEFLGSHSSSLASTEFFGTSIST